MQGLAKVFLPFQLFLILSHYSHKPQYILLGFWLKVFDTLFKVSLIKKKTRKNYAQFFIALTTMHIFVLVHYIKSK